MSSGGEWAAPVAEPASRAGEAPPAAGDSPRGVLTADAAPGGGWPDIAERSHENLPVEEEGEKVISSGGAALRPASETRRDLGLLGLPA